MNFLKMFKNEKETENVTTPVEKPILFRSENLITALNDKDKGDDVRLAFLIASKEIMNFITLSVSLKNLEKKGYLALSFKDIEREENIEKDLKQARRAAYKSIVYLNMVVKSTDSVNGQSIIPYIKDDDTKMLTSVCCDFLNFVLKETA